MCLTTFICYGYVDGYIFITILPLSCSLSFWDFPENPGYSLATNHSVMLDNELDLFIKAPISMLNIFDVLDNNYMLWMCLWMYLWKCPYTMLAPPSMSMAPFFMVLEHILGYIIAVCSCWGHRTIQNRSHSNIKYGRCLTTFICCGCVYELPRFWISGSIPHTKLQSTVVFEWLRL